MRDAVAMGVDRTLSVLGWTALIVATVLLGVAVTWHLDYSPFTHPGATPTHERMELLALDGFRWAALVIGCAIAAMKSAPRQHGTVAAAWLVPPIVTLMFTLAMAALATFCWLDWTSRLPNDDWMGNVVLATVYFGVPAALIVSAAFHMERRRKPPAPARRVPMAPPPAPVRTPPRPGRAGPPRGPSSNRGRSGRR